MLIFGITLAGLVDSVKLFLDLEFIDMVMMLFASGSTETAEVPVLGVETIERKSPIRDGVPCRLDASFNTCLAVGHLGFLAVNLGGGNREMYSKSASCFCC